MPTVKFELGKEEHEIARQIAQDLNLTWREVCIRGLGLHECTEDTLFKKRKIGRPKSKPEKDYSELEGKILQFALPIYENHATERKRLKIVYSAHDYFKLKGVHGILPVIYKDFEVYDKDGEINENEIKKITIQIAETENKLLAPCADGDFLIQCMFFSCKIFERDGKLMGTLRECLNGEKTPGYNDAMRATE